MQIEPLQTGNEPRIPPIEKYDPFLPILNFKVNAEWVNFHNVAVRCARNLKSAYSDLLKALIDISEREIYFQFEVTSLHDYCVDVLDLPPQTAYDFTDVIRTSKLIPALAQAVISGRTTISKARRVCSVITVENQKGWIDLACECSQKIIKKAVAMANPRSIVPETLNYVSGDVLELRLAVSESWAELLADTKDLMSQGEQRAVSAEEALFSLMTAFKQKNDPVKKAERAKVRDEKQQSQEQESKVADTQTNDRESTEINADVARVRSSGNINSSARYRPRLVEYVVDLRDQNQCTYVDRYGRRCRAKRWLEKHHITAFANGGMHTANNLETLCSGHHRMKHQRANH